MKAVWLCVLCACAAWGVNASKVEDGLIRHELPVIFGGRQMYEIEYTLPEDKLAREHIANRSLTARGKK